MNKDDQLPPCPPQNKTPQLCNYQSSLGSLLTSTRMHNYYSTYTNLVLGVYFYSYVLGVYFYSQLHLHKKNSQLPLRLRRSPCTLSSSILSDLTTARPLGFSATQLSFRRSSSFTYSF